VIFPWREPHGRGRVKGGCGSDSRVKKGAQWGKIEGV
jgi:hypothetical protein